MPSRPSWPGRRSHPFLLPFMMNLKHRKTTTLSAFGLPVLLAARAICGAAEPSADLEALKKRLDQLEQTVATQSQTIEAQRQLIDGRVTPAAAQDDAAGTPKKWHEKLDLAFGATTVLQGSTGVKRQFAAGGNEFDASLSLDVALTFPVSEHGTAYALIEAGSGCGLDANFCTLSGVNHDAYGERSLRPSEVWYEHRWLDDKLRLRGGWVDLSTDFDRNEVANCEHSQFLSSGFVNNLAIEFPCDNGIGAMVWGSPCEWIDLGAGVAEADADWQRVGDCLFAISEIDFKPKIFGKPGNYRFYTWVNGENHARICNPTENGGEAYGFGFSFDQQITSTLTAFARYGWQPEDVARIEQACSGGLQISGKTFGRPDDAIGVACGWALLGSDSRQLYALSGARAGDETHLEVYYRLRATEYLEFTPDIQWVMNPDGNRDNPSFGVFGLRARLAF
jgi:high affinity Mn2+ porin